MKLLCCLMVLVVLRVSQAKDIESNEINASTPSVNLDTTLRKALLRALTELENEDEEKRRLEEENYSTTSNPDEERIVEKASASAVSFYTNEVTQETTTEKQETTEKPVVIIQRSSGVSHSPIISVLNSEDANEEFITSASSSFTGSGKNNLVSSVNSVGDGGDKSFTAGVKSLPVKSTTPAPRVTTQENEAKVEDVQFFSAPLVAAFTVHQDERGLPKKVEPIYKSESNKGGVQKSSKIQEEILQLEKQKREHEDLLRQKQILERQVQQQKILIEQQQLQEYQQKFLLQEQQKKLAFEEQRKKALLQEQQKRLDEQKRLLSNQGFTPINANQRFKENTFVSFQPSISISSAELRAGALPLNGQILPIKNHANFLQSPPTTLNQYKPLQQQSFNNFQNFPNNFVQNVPDVRQGTRVFRQEFGTGNFGFNSAQQNQNRFFRSNQEQAQPQHFNQQLNNLLLNSGISGLNRNVRQNEDLNLVSKVLSYNVGRDQFFRPVRF